MLDDFIKGYAECLIWVELDQNYSISDISEEAWGKIKQDCAVFVERCGDLLREEYLLAPANNWNECAGSDFYLTRNGHEAGFWDGGWANGDELTRIAKGFRECYPYVGDDGKIYL